MPAPYVPHPLPRPAEPVPPGFSRDRDLERARGLNRPADSNLNANDRQDDPRPGRDIHYSPGDSSS